MRFACAFAFLGLVARSASAAGGGWDYDNQDKWKDVVYTDGTVNECADAPTATKGNSPIDIPNSECDTAAPILSSKPGNCTLADMIFSTNDHGVKTSYVAGSCEQPSMVIPEKPEMTFTAAQYHIHTSCEHNVDSVGCDAELHIVHLNADSSEAAVLGFQFNNDAEEPNPYFDLLLGCWDAINTAFVETCDADKCDAGAMHRRKLAGHTSCPATAFSPYKLVPEGAGYYYYMGGLTTPPCTQFVNWNLVDTEVSISLEQWTRLASMILNWGGTLSAGGTCTKGHSVASVAGSTSRVPQPIGARAITHKCSVTA